MFKTLKASGRSSQRSLALGIGPRAQGQPRFKGGNRCDAGACHIFATKVLLETQKNLALPKFEISAELFVAHQYIQRTLEIISNKQLDRRFYTSGDCSGSGLESER
jgi:hypothetical protein